MEIYGLTYLMLLMDSDEDGKLPITYSETLKAMADGVRDEPQNFGDFVNEYISWIKKSNKGMPDDECLDTSLFNIIIASVVADREFSRETVVRSPDNPPKSVRDIISNPEAYGPVMNAVSEHLGLKGLELSIFFEGLKRKNPNSPKGYTQDGFCY